jgi:hypothetical protein
MLREIFYWGCEMTVGVGGVAKAAALEEHGNPETDRHRPARRFA